MEQQIAIVRVGQWYYNYSVIPDMLSIIISRKLGTYGIVHKRVRAEKGAAIVSRGGERVCTEVLLSHLHLHFHRTRLEPLLLQRGESEYKRI
jgi:hypothetical protein